MFDLQYYSFNKFGISSPTPFSANKIIQTRDVRNVRLQQIEHKIKSFKMMRVYIVLILLIIFLHLLIDCYKIHQLYNINILGRIIQILPYLYGIYAHSSKKCLQMQAFICLLIALFISHLLFGNMALKLHDSAGIFEQIICLILNAFIFWESVVISSQLKQRDNLRKELQSLI